MATFVQVGRHWLNLELVTSMEFRESPKKPGEIVAMRVHYSTGKHQDLAGAEEIKQLQDFLEAHQAK